MTMEAEALCNRPLRSIGEWQAAIDDLGYDLKLCSTRDLSESSGLLPALWRGRDAPFECEVIPISDLTETYPDIEFGGPWPCVYAFYFSTPTGCAGTWLAVAACLARTGGAAFDPQEGVLLTAEEARRYAASMEAFAMKFGDAAQQAP